MNIEAYIKDIKMYRDQAAQFNDDSPGSLIRRVDLLTRARELMGRVSAYMDGEYKRAYNRRKIRFAETKRDTAKGDKTIAAELAIIPLREQEAEAYERMMLWRNELASLTEHLHELRLRIRIDLNMMGGGG